MSVAKRYLYKQDHQTPRQRARTEFLPSIYFVTRYDSSSADYLLEEVQISKWLVKGGYAILVRTYCHFKNGLLNQMQSTDARNILRTSPIINSSVSFQATMKVLYSQQSTVTQTFFLVLININ